MLLQSGVQCRVSRRGLWITAGWRARRAFHTWGEWIGCKREQLWREVWWVSRHWSPIINIRVATDSAQGGNTRTFSSCAFLNIYEKMLAVWSGGRNCLHANIWLLCFVLYGPGGEKLWDAQDFVACEFCSLLHLILKQLRETIYVTLFKQLALSQVF